MATRLRHIAIIVPDPEKAAKFFEEAFGMTRAGTARRGIYMSDGIINVALLKTEGDEKRPASITSACGSTISTRRRRRCVDAGGSYLGRPADLAEFVLRGEIPAIPTASCSTSPTRLGRRHEGSGRKT